MLEAAHLYLDSAEVKKTLVYTGYTEKNGVFSKVDNNFFLTPVYLQSV
jgi:hypothetical protein